MDVVGATDPGRADVAVPLTGTVAPISAAPVDAAPISADVNTQRALARCRRYRTRNGLYGVVQPELGRIELEIGSVGAVTMPSTLGARVRATLGTQQRGGPIIGHPRSNRWTFLTGPTDAAIRDMTMLRVMFHRGVDVVAPGTRIVLPSPADEQAGYRVWIDPPVAWFRPDPDEVIAAVQA